MRVSEKEDYQLEARAAKVSTIGFELVGPRSEYELTFDEIQAVNAELRLSLVKQALEECHQYNDAFAEAAYDEAYYRISSTRFDSGNVMNTANNRAGFGAAFTAQMASSTASPVIAHSMGGGPLGGSGNSGQIYQTEMMEVEDDADEGTTDMGVSTRFSMVGTFVLRSVHE